MFTLSSHGQCKWVSKVCFVKNVYNSFQQFLWIFDIQVALWHWHSSSGCFCQSTFPRCLNKTVFALMSFRLKAREKLNSIWISLLLEYVSNLSLFFQFVSHTEIWIVKVLGSLAPLYEKSSLNVFLISQERSWYGGQRSVFKRNNRDSPNNEYRQTRLFTNKKITKKQNKNIQLS